MKVFDETIQVPESELFFHHEIPQKKQHGCINRDSEKQFGGVTIYWMHTTESQRKNRQL